METYSYPTTDTANDRVNPVKLSSQISTAGLLTLGLVVQGTASVAIGLFAGGVIDVLFANPLSENEQATLADVVAAHVGTATVSVQFKATAEVVHDAVAFGVGPLWADLGGVVTSIDFFVPDLPKALARVVGSYRALGVGAEMRVVMGLDGAATPMSAVQAMPDTLGAWALIPSFNTNVPPPAGQTLYRIQGRCNLAVSAAVQFTSMTLLELVT